MGCWAGGFWEWEHTFELLGREVETQIQGAFFAHFLQMCLWSWGSRWWGWFLRDRSQSTHSLVWAV